MSSFVKSHSIYLNFQWDDDEVHFVLDQRALEFDLIVLFVYMYQYMAKSIATCKKNPYIINQNHIFSKSYCEVISG
jgi:hypothetical protein